MDKFKLFQLFVFAFALSLIFQYFFFPTKQPVGADSQVILSIKDDTLSLPNIPKIDLKNTATGSFVIHPCEDVKITIDSVPLVGMSGSAPSFCKSITATGLSTTPVPMTALYQVFASKAGKYSVAVHTPYGERGIFFTMSAPGFFRSTLSTLVYEPIYNLFVALLTFLPGHSLGWAIIIVTFIIRLILLVPQNHMLEGQKKLQKLQPKIKALQKEYKDDQATLGMKMLELYKTENVNPL
jgi:membrane protein insertase Oxa1/YidC/SpoIIIJ